MPPAAHFPSIRIEGGFFSPDLLEALAAGGLPGQRAQDFNLPPQRSLTDEIAAVFHELGKQWQIFRNRLARLDEGDLATTPTRDLWLVPFFSFLGYEPYYNPRAYVIDGMNFAISHRAGMAEDAPPLHLVGARQELGRLPPSGRPRLSPHALMQEYLNRSEALWGIVSNGEILRLLRDSTFVRRQAYLEFDLKNIFEEERFADFVLLYRLLHRSRLPKGGADAEPCWLEKYYQQSLEQGGRVREHLREGVEQCLKQLAAGLLSHPQSGNLRGWVKQHGALAFYRELLRLVYRFLFLLVSEERGLISREPLYLEHYGVSHLRRLADQRAAYTDDTDLWLSLRALWLILTDEKLAAKLKAPPLNGELFAPLELDGALISNRNLLSAFWHLAYYQEGSSPPRRVNYAALDTEELGSVYESLLDYHPTLFSDGQDRLRFELSPGSERKSTGSYYTPPELVGELIKSALEPVMEERLKKHRTAEKKESALLSLKVLDPACGSGHFLLAAARRLGKELARIRSGEDEPAPERVREATRDVVAHCIYGVDKNPLAVELARVALWLESHAEGKPLTFLEHHIKCGDSLVGVFDLEVLQEGLPDAAFEPVSGDDRKLAASLKRQNKAEREGQMTLFGWNFDLDLTPLAENIRQIESIPDDSPQDVRRKRQAYEARLTDPRLRRLKDACDLWTAAYFQSLSPSPPPKGESGGEGVITTDAVRRALAGQPLPPQTLAAAQALAAENRFFHWQLEFAEVFEGGGFDIVIGNPPFSAELNRATKKFVNTIYNDSGSTNTASLFWFRTERLTRIDGKIGLVTPKSITYSTRWTKTRLALLPYLEEVIDCGEAWENVLLEQVLVVATRVKSLQDVKTKRLYHGTHEPIYIPRQILGAFDVWFVSSESGLLEILERVRKFSQEWISLGKILVSHRGGRFQKIVKSYGGLPVIGGKDVAPFVIKSVSGFLTSDQVDDLGTFKSPKAVFQNIVAYVSRPAPHVKIIGAVDYDGAICLDTINIVRCPTGIFSPEAIVGILSSNFINWLIHRVVFGFAQRTMHLDQFALNRVFIPTSLLKSNEELDILAKKIIHSRGEDRVALSSIEEIIQNAYGVDKVLRKEVMACFENPPY